QGMENPWRRVLCRPSLAAYARLPGQVHGLRKVRQEASRSLRGRNPGPPRLGRVHSGIQVTLASLVRPRLRFGMRTGHLSLFISGALFLSLAGCESGGDSGPGPIIPPPAKSALDQRIASIQPALAQLRGMSFTSPIQSAVISREDFARETGSSVE